ncbi:hypothetical protein GCM10008119_37620 [Pedobacter mendelii]|uniref:Uncharacterized protein n=1 Tax=Pedobacter mendelii TaxID=1908240 RepID=A0ABQ2BPC8_9SPHI|nr:hypothetical protein GCM10008119_37620 [Pedobacter mendelii]
MYPAFVALCPDFLPFCPGFVVLAGRERKRINIVFILVLSFTGILNSKNKHIQFKFKTPLL